MPTRNDIRNVAIVAHVDHGKTTLVDAMLWQAGGVPAPRARRRARDGLQRPGAREGHHHPREEHRGALQVAGGRLRHRHQHHRHPRPRRLRRRGRARPVHGRRRRAAGRRLRGPAAADPVRAAQGAVARSCRSILVINKIDRPDARIAEVVDETYELFLDLDATEDADRVPDRLRLRPRRHGLAEAAGQRHRAGQRRTSSRCSRRSWRPSRRRRTTRAPRCQAHVTNLDASNFLGRIALCRVHQGTIRKGQQVAWMQARRRRSSGSRSPSC